MDYFGSTGPDTFTGTDGEDNFYLDQGGNDTASGGAADDSFYLGNSLNARDSIDGGEGASDAIFIAGDYTAGLTIGSNLLTGVEEFFLQTGFHYDLTLSRSLLARADILNFYFTSPYSNPTSVRIDGSAIVGDLTFNASSGDDVLIGGSGNDFFRSRLGGNDTFDGGGGYNRISFYGSNVGVKVDLNIVGTFQDTGYGNVALSNINDLSGSLYNDRLTGTDKDNWLISNGGNDRIFGNGGNDFIQIGHSTSGDATDTIVNGGVGTDLIDFNANTFANAAATVDLTIAGQQDTGQGVYTLINIEDVTGTQFDDRFTGDRGANALFGGDGADTLSGLAGADMLYGDAFKTHASTHGISGPAVIDMNETAAFVDILDGGAGDDRLFGGGGDDSLTGGLGADRLTGGDGNDLFVYASIAESTRAQKDVIVDFAHGDRIDLSAIDANTALDGDQAFHLGRTAGRAGDIVVTFDEDKTILSLYVDGDNRVDMVIQLTGQIAVFDMDFVF